MLKIGSLNERCHILEFQNIEKNISNNTFQIKNWKRDGGGGGKMSVMKGDVFEKVGVNISTVHGKFSQQFRKKYLVQKKMEILGKWYISCSSPKNPFIPAAHVNTRLISTSKSWFGGGGDITPMKPAPEMSKLFIKILKMHVISIIKNIIKNLKNGRTNTFF